MNIGIDLDDVLADTLPALIEYHNDTYNTTFTEDDYHSFHLWKVWGCTKEESNRRVYHFFETPYFKNIKTVSGSQKATKVLKEEHNLYIITSRPRKFSKDTLAWIEKYFPGVFNEVFFTNYSEKNNSDPKKNHVCDLLNVDVFIDDSLDYALECFNEKRQVFLFEAPSNKNKKFEENLYRVKSWKEILEILNSNTEEKCFV